MRLLAGVRHLRHLRRVVPRPATLGRAARATGHGWQQIESMLLDWSRPSPLPADPRRRLRLTIVVWVLAVALSGIGFGTSAEVYDVDRLGWGPMPLVGLLAGLPFGLVLSRPMLAWLVSAVSAVALSVTLPLRDTDPWRWTTLHALVIFALLLAVSLREPARRVVAAWAGTVLLFAWGTQPGIRAGWMVGVTIIVVIGLLIGRLAVTNSALTRQADQTSAEQERRLVLEERARIARDLHDIVAHHMSLVVVQAETAAYRIGGLSDEARAELASISGSARAALVETRALLAVLRNENDEAEHAPQPGLERLAELVDGARRAGQDVDIQVRIDPGSLRPGTSLAAYRIVQESLANAARHAPGASVRLDVHEQDGALHIGVVNARPREAVTTPLTTPPATLLESRPESKPNSPTLPERRHGIIGMRERAAAEGGSLLAAPEADGGFVVQAVLPLQAESVNST